MSEPDPQVRVVGAQAGAQVDVNVRVTTGGAASACARQRSPMGGGQQRARSLTLPASLAQQGGADGV